MWQGPLLARLETVADLSARDRALVADLCRDVRRVPAKKHIISEGERPEHIHLVVEGWAARYKLLDTGARQIVALLIPGDFCDLHATILGHMDHGILALSPCQVAYIPSDQVDLLTCDHNGLTRALLW